MLFDGRHSLVVTLVVLLSAMVPARGEGGDPGGGAITMKQHVLSDPGMNNMKSHTVLAPADWKVEGGGWWAGPNFFKILPSQDITVTAPDGRCVRIGPSVGAVDFRPSPMAMRQFGAKRPAEGAADGGMPVLYMPNDANEWKTWIERRGISQTYPGATDIQVRDVVVIPELTAILQRQLQPIKEQQAQMNQQSQMMGGGMRNFADAFVYGATCAYEHEGRKWDQLFVFGAGYLGTETELGVQIWWSIEPNVSYRAPAGQLDANMPLLMAIANSVRTTPEWQRMKDDHAMKMNQIAAKGAADRSRIIAKSNAEISKMITDGYNRRQAIQDETHRKVINSIRGVEDYTTPDSGTSVQLPNNYNHVYSNGAGDYILTNDANYNPNTDSSINNHTWNTMEAVQGPQ